MSKPPITLPFLADLESRDLLRQKTAEASEPDFSKSPALYVGFDPSAISLHAGSLIPLTAMDRWRRRGGQIIVLLGGATGLVGDPSGKDQERAMESQEVVAERIEAIGRQISAFFARTEGREPITVNNADWYRGMDVLRFLRDVGKNFSVNQMLARDSVRSRIDNRDQGISFTEFSYQLLQAYDFLHLNRTYQCRWQMGASDQWGNIVSGTDLIRRVTGSGAHGVTLPLLTNSEGKKYGKSEKGAIWLDPNLTSPYDFYQFWLNSSDSDVGRFLAWLTDLEAHDIADLLAGDLSARAAQRQLAFTLTSRLHGAQAAELARASSEVMFSGKYHLLSESVAEMLEAAVGRVEVTDAAVTFPELLVDAGAAKSKAEARRLIEQRAVFLNGVPVTDPAAATQALSAVGLGILSVGKHRRFVVRKRNKERSASTA
ncbi:MAG TPA: tyrosine--tRNA ligase [Allosphingosinicella sp.]